jgi:hypothetical protein
MNDGCFIPKKIKVGYQERSDTYSGKLAYVIYYDEKNKLRKENSFEQWRHKSFQPNEFDNECLEGFVLNKKVGDYVDHFHRQSYIRIYDPRGFEVEITVTNLLYILENCDCLKGKGLDGRFCYGWFGTELVLLPENSTCYKESKRYSNSLYENKKVKKDDLQVGKTYLMRRNQKVIYLGYKPYFGKGYYGLTRYENVFLGYRHYYVSIDDLPNFNDNNKYHYFSPNISFSPIQELDETYDYSICLNELNNKTSFTGMAYCYYEEKELENLIKKSNNGLFLYVEKNLELKKEFCRKVIENKKTMLEVTITNFWKSSSINVTAKEITKLNEGFLYVGHFINGELIKKEKYAEIN